MQTPTLEGFQLSPQQQRLWQFQLEQPIALYATCLVCLEGDLNPPGLEAAIQQVVQQHEILRTTIAVIPGTDLPLQVITDRLPTLEYRNEIEFRLVYSSLLKNGESDHSSFRAKLFQLQENHHVLQLILPAWCTDAIALTHLVDQISQAYGAIMRGETYEVDPVQYADLAAWQCELLESDESAAGRAYWRQLSWIPLEQLKLPQQFNGSEFQFQQFDFELSDTQTQALRAIAQSHQVSLSTLLLTAWQILLWRHMDQSTLIVGVTDAGRPYEELETALGPLAKVVPIGANLDSALPFVTLLNQIRTSLQTAAQWQEVFTWEDVPAIANHPPFFPLSFEWLEQPPSFASGNLNWTIQQRQSQIDPFQLKLLGQPSNHLKLTLHYNARSFAAETVQQLAARLQVLLTDIIRQPQAAIGAFEILTESDRQQLFVQFSSPISDQSPVCIHQLFEAQVARSPNQVAIRFEDQQLTYRQLDGRANQLAHDLQQQGIGLETPVAIYLERSPEIIVALLAVLKAGAAYVPFDSSLPPAALTARLQEGQISALITQSSLRATLAPEAASTVICLDDVSEKEISEKAPASPVTPANLAYILFTSGSTGKPKGVAVEHRQLNNYLHGIRRSLQLDELPPEPNYALVSTFAADLGHTMIFTALCWGGCLHILSQERVMNPMALAAYSDRYPIDCLKIVPSHLRALLTSSEADRFLPRQRLILGGEVLDSALVEQVQQCSPDCQIFNHYGPTETTVGVLTYAIPTKFPSASKTVPLGIPLVNTQIYLLNELQQPVPIGVPGEIYVGGANVARGYWRDPELTEKRFLSHCAFLSSKAPEAAERLYKTGDLAHYRPDGTIEFLGRIDDQVKIRGFRIEPAEVEARLQQHPAVRSAVVIKWEEQPHQPELVAYVVPQPSETPGLAEKLRSFLASQLPEYMVPSAIMTLKALPLTANGKLDRQALPTPAASLSRANPTFTAPRTAIERQLATIWAGVLSVDRVGVDDNFFELGGDSILSIQAIAKANQVGLHFTPRQLFEHQTIAQLAAVIAAQPQDKRSVNQEQVTGPVPLTPIQQRFFEQNLAEPHHWNQAVFLEAQAPLQVEALQQAIQHLMHHHDALRLRFQRIENIWQQVNSDLDVTIPLTVVDLSEQLEQQEETIAQTAHWAQTSLNLETGPLLRVVLFQLGQRPDQLLIVIHHLAVDGLSWRVLLEDLQTTYQQLVQNQTVQLPLKTTSFQQWAQQLQSYAQSEACQQTAEYWLRQAAIAQNSVPQNSIPQRPDASENTIAAAQTFSLALSLNETQTILQTLPKVYRAQVDEVLLTALTHSLAIWTGDTDLLIDLEGHGREALPDLDVSRTVGWFTAIYPVHFAVNPQADPGTVLKSVKEHLRQIPRRGIDYGILRYLNSAGDIHTVLQNAPSAQVLFNYLGQFDSTLEASSLFRLANIETGVTRSPRAQRQYWLEINALVLEGCLQLDWIYNPTLHSPQSIEQLTQQFLASLRSLIPSSPAPVNGLAPSDFPQANVSQADLDKLFARISQTSGGAQ